MMCPTFYCFICRGDHRSSADVYIFRFAQLQVCVANIVHAPTEVLQIKDYLEASSIATATATVILNLRGCYLLQ